MLTWDQLDELDKIANDRTKSAEARTRQIMANWDEWNGAVNSCIPYLPLNSALFGSDDIDPVKEIMKSRMPIPGQTGRFMYPDVNHDPCS